MRLSIIVPLAPKEMRGASLLADLRNVPVDVEIILCGVAGCALPFKTVECVGGATVRHCTSRAGRAVQMNAGARAARGRWLWFLHADSRVPAATLAALRRFIASDTGALGYFALRYADDGPALVRLNAMAANWRSRWLGLPFGDQGFVMTRTLFQHLGGYDETLARGEDHAFVWRARALKVARQRIPALVGTSARNYAERGWLWYTTVTVLRTLTQAWAGWRALRRARREPRV